MDERFGRKGLWIGLGAAALIFLCLMLMAGAAFVAVLAPSRVAPVYVQPPTAGEGALQPPAVYYGGSGPSGGLFSGVAMLFKLAFLGLFLLLLLGVVRRLAWGPHHYWAHGGAPVPPSHGGEGAAGGWHGHWPHSWGPRPSRGPAPGRARGENEEPGDREAGETASYSGPQE